MLTERLSLSPLGPADLEEAHQVYTDPGTWQHLPSGRHTELAQTEQLLARSAENWEKYHAGLWAVRLRKPINDLAAGSFIGNGGIVRTVGDAWNLGYRLTPASWGAGLATELSRAALELAADAAPQHAVTARVLENNPASIAVLEKIGLRLCWMKSAAADQPGRTAGATLPTETTELPRRIYADRELSEELLTGLIALG
ncbi:GNAT family N-acetyltransferase [Psychromicrobium sp. YIM B11713]|uniref:GNAT family N-acetyltransferase n=1 Tax=Psychromicrobium sp. YIM B11713 TaxID=3145233 RepID=UPI00374E63E5